MNNPIRKIFKDPHMVVLLLAFAISIGTIWLLGAALAPVVVAIAIAYALDDPIERLKTRGLPRYAGIVLIYSLFLLLYTAMLLLGLPVALRQSGRLMQELPNLLQVTSDYFRQVELPWLNSYAPNFVQELPERLINTLVLQSKNLLSKGLDTFGQVTVWVVNLMIIPLLVLFFLIDKERLLRGIAYLLPRNLQLVSRIWLEMEERMVSYVRGKVWEILAVAVATWAVFSLLGFRFSFIMAIISGISVLIPYVGAFAVAVPLFFLGAFQWGFQWELTWLMLAYVVLQMLDGNVLVPFLFSEAVKMPPTMILIGIIVFGSLWGVWGVFFAIPLATLCKAVAFTWIEWRDTMDAKGDAELQKQD